jgi:hypothetical protein
MTPFNACSSVKFAVGGGLWLLVGAYFACAGRGVDEVR